MENLNIKDMVYNHNLVQVISDVAWGISINFLDYKLQQKGDLFVEVDRFFLSYKTCSNCLYQISNLPLDIREWTCPSCGTSHHRDENAIH